ncbi:MAG: LysM peptidoglycan-binding domain-containing protein [Defluviitaleaceae bacterium]|nr:LysM peptidoglycan-binding domain-containing protein [Defluviitaleaceae bacterium]
MSKNISDDDKNLQEEKKDVGTDAFSRATSAVSRLFDKTENDNDEAPDIQSAFVKGFERASEKNPTKRRLRANVPEPADEPETAAEDEPDEPVVDRPKRREHATTRLLHANSPEDTYEMERRERRERRRNPAPKPAVLVNVPVQEGEEQPVAEDLETFRRRYNSQELFSPPRNQNRPVRRGREDVRKNRERPAERDTEIVSPLRMAATVAALVVLVLFAVITLQMLSLRNKLNDAEEKLSEAQNALTSAEASLGMVSGLQETISILERDKAELERQLLEIPGQSENQLGESSAGNPSQTPSPSPTPGLPQLPTTITVQQGDNLGRIARRHYGNSNESTIQHIQNVNNITNPNRIQIGQTLQITPMN